MGRYLHARGLERQRRGAHRAAARHPPPRPAHRPAAAVGRHHPVDPARHPPARRLDPGLTAAPAANDKAGPEGPAFVHVVKTPLRPQWMPR
ncbi:hypothetical protein BGLA2_1000013 [Burkholderia gladioli]|nr:hypothetical protein BGLA2_1000013 [Burkholderia gladioli]